MIAGLGRVAAANLIQYLSVAVRLLLGDRLSQGHELVGGVRRAPATAAAWILSYRQQPTRRRGHHLRPVFQGASNRPTRSLLNLSKAAKNRIRFSIIRHAVQRRSPKKIG